MAEELAPAFSASEWKTSWQSLSLGGYRAQSTLLWSGAISSDSQRAALTAKPPLTEASPVSAQAWASLKWLMYCGLEALARGNSPFFIPERLLSTMEI